MGDLVQVLPRIKGDMIFFSIHVQASMTTCKYFLIYKTSLPKKPDKKDVQRSENEQIFVIN